MIELNLLSSIEKTNSNLMWKYVIIKTVISIILTLSFVISGVLFGAKLLLLQKFNEVQEQAAAINITHQKINERVNNYNRQIRILDDIQKEYTNWPLFLYSLNNKITSGIYLSRVEIIMSEKKVNLSGLSNTREDLLTLKQSLEECEFIGNISLPLNTLLKKQNIDFSINGTINKLSCDD
jgi:Tfp pilus assembly protein PilN